MTRFRLKRILFRGEDWRLTKNMSVNQILFPEAISSLIKEKQRAGFYGEVTIGITKGEVQFVEITARQNLDELVANQVLRKNRLIVRSKPGQKEDDTVPNVPDESVTSGTDQL